MSNSNLNTPICITQFFLCIKTLYYVEKKLNKNKILFYM